jgi:LPS-assembly lipoprotein
MIRKFAVVLCSLIVAACGFQLRGSADLPFATLHIALPESSELRADLARTISSSSKTHVVGDPKEAQAILSVMADTQTKKILSLNSAGRVREYELVRTFVFQVNDSAGQFLVPRSQIVMRRDITFNDDQVLSKEAEEVLLWRDIQNDLLQQLLRRLAAAKLKSAESE